MVAQAVIDPTQVVIDPIPYAEDEIDPAQVEIDVESVPDESALTKVLKHQVSEARALGTIVSSLALLPGAGIRAALEFIPTISIDPDKLIDKGSLEQANKVFEEIMGTPGKLITTPEEAQMVEKAMLLSKPFEWAGEAGRLVGYGINKGLRELGLPADTYLEPLMSTYGEAALVLTLPALVKKLKISFKQMTVSERGLMVQSLMEAKKANPKMTEGQLIRKYDNVAWREQALKKFVAPKSGDPVPAASIRHIKPDIGPDVGARAPARKITPAPRKMMTAAGQISPRTGRGVVAGPRVGPTYEEGVMRPAEGTVYPPPPVRQELRAVPERPGAVGREIGVRVRPPKKPVKLAPPGPPVVKPAPVAPAPTDVMIELKKRMGYYELDEKVRKFSTMPKEQQATQIESLAKDISKTLSEADAVKLTSYKNVILKTARDVNLPKEITDNLVFKIKNVIKWAGRDPQLAAKSIRDHTERGTMFEELAGVTQILASGRATVSLSLGIEDLASVERVTRHELYHVAKRILLPDDAIAKQNKYFKNNEETEADAFADYVKDFKSKASLAQPSWLRTQWDNMIAFLTKIGNWMHKKGYHSPDDVFGAIVKGEYKPLKRGVKQRKVVPVEVKAAALKKGELAEPAKGAVVEGAIYRGKVEVPADIAEGETYYEWTEQTTGSDFILTTLDPVEIAARAKSVRDLFRREIKLATMEKAVKEGKPEKVRAEVERARKEFLTPVEDSPLDKAAVAYMKSGKFTDYTDNMPALGELTPSDIFRVDPEAKKLIATVTTKSGKVKPAIRQSGFHAMQRFVDAFADVDPKTGNITLKDGIADVSKRAERWMDPTRFMQTIDQGFFGGPAQEYIMWPTRMTTLAKIKWADHNKTKLSNTIEKYKLNRGKDRKAAGDIIEHISNKEAWAQNTFEMLKIPEVKRALLGYTPARQLDIVRAAVDMRKQFSTMLRQINKARNLRNQKEIPYREFYRPHIMEANLWSRLMGLRVKPAEIVDRPELPDFIKPNQPFNPRALARSGLMEKYPKERDLVKLMTDYVETAAKDIFDTNIVHNNKVYASVLRSIGMENAAAGIERWTAEVHAGVTPPITKWARETFPEPAIKGLYGLRRNLTRAVFPLNWTWNMFIQTSSAGLTYTRYGNLASIAGLQYMLNPAVHQMIKQNAYSSIIKSRWGGKAHYQDVQGSILRNRRLQSRTIDTVEDYANFLTSAVEDTLTGHAVAAAFYHGKKLGLTGRALWEYAGEGGAKTQSMYNYQDQPGFLRTREAGSLMPFQTFSFEIFNTMREMNLPVVRRIVGKAGAYETLTAGSPAGKALLSKRLMMLGRWIAAMIVTNAVVEKAIGRKPWDWPSSFIPFIGYLTGDMAGRGPEFTPKQYISEFRTAVKNALEYDNYDKMRKWSLRYHMLAGTQFNRMLDGMEVVSKGGRVENVAGNLMFKVDPDEWWKAIAAGPYRTTAGKEYIAKLEGKKTKKKVKRKVIQ